MKYLNSQSGSILGFAAAVIIILVFTAMGLANVSFLVYQRFLLQSELDLVALQLVQQVDYESYFETGFTSTLQLNPENIDQILRSALQSGAIGQCSSAINTAISGLTVSLQLDCPVPLPFLLPGVAASVRLEMASTARLAQVVG